MRAVAALDEARRREPDRRARPRATRQRSPAPGSTPARPQRRAGHRVFGSKPGAYGAGLQALIDERGWETRRRSRRGLSRLGRLCLWRAEREGAAARDLLRRRGCADVDAVVHNQDNREHDLLDCDDYYQFEGGLAAAVETLSGAAPRVYHNDHSRPERPRIRTLDEEIARVVRGRAVNPKWIAGVMRHGYKGAFEIAATVDYLFAFAATTRRGARPSFRRSSSTPISATTRCAAFIAEANPPALREMASALLRGDRSRPVDAAPQQRL